MTSPFWTEVTVPRSWLRAPYFIAVPPSPRDAGFGRLRRGGGSPPARARENVPGDVADGTFGVDGLADRRVRDLRRAAHVPIERGADLAPAQAVPDGPLARDEAEDRDPRAGDGPLDDRALRLVLDDAREEQPGQAGPGVDAHERRERGFRDGVAVRLARGLRVEVGELGVHERRGDAAPFEELHALEADGRLPDPARPGEDEDVAHRGERTIPDPSSGGPAVPAKPNSTPAAKKAVKPIPDGYARVSPYLIARDASRLMDFAKRVLGAKETVRMPTPDGKVHHGEVQIGDCVVMFAEASDRQPANASMLYVYVDDVDATYAKALAAGATSAAAPKDRFYGDRNAAVKDHAGNQWWFALHVEDPTPEEMRRRMAALDPGK